MKNKEDKVLSISVIVLSIVLIAVSVIYLATGKVVPGLIPLITTVLMIPMIAIWGRQPDKGKLYAILFSSAAILNLVAGIMQIVQAL